MAVIEGTRRTQATQREEVARSLSAELSAKAIRPTIGTRFSNRRWPMLLSGALLISGMAFMLWWPALTEHKVGWYTGGDMWGIFRAAHYIGWGYLGGVYDPTTGVNSLPGLEILLAPVAMISGHLGLTESFSPFFLPQPTAALLLEPIELLLAATVLFAVDALAEHLQVGRSRRVGLCLASAVLVWPTVAIWGHAEDCLALALAIYAVVALLNGKWRACGWLFGFAVVTQPLVVMMLPLLVAATPLGQRVATVLRPMAITVVIVGVAFASNASNAFRSIVQQPTPPSINHATPWISLAPRVTNVISGGGHYASLSYSSGRYVQAAAHAHPHAVVLVSGGAGRVLEALLALMLGLYLWRRPQSPDRFVWLMAVALGMRCLFEAVMTPYYLAPPLILALAIASRQSRVRFAAACLIAGEVTVFAYHDLSPWAWWLPVVASMLAVLALGYPKATEPSLPPVLAPEVGGRKNPRRAEAPDQSSLPADGLPMHNSVG